MDEERERWRKVSEPGREEEEEVRSAIKRLKSGKVLGPDDIPVHVWRCLRERAADFLSKLFESILESERMPKELRSVLIH